MLIAGKKTTVDGSILFAKIEGDGTKEVDYLWYVPRKTHEPGSVVKLKAGGTIPQMRETYAYFWDQCPNTSYSNGIINEWGVAFGSNGCTSKEDPVKEVEARGIKLKVPSKIFTTSLKILSYPFNSKNVISIIYRIENRCNSHTSSSSLSIN